MRLGATALGIASLVHGTMIAGLLLPALAQSRESVSSTGVEEVAVSANRREEKVSDVPMAISAISGDSLRNRNLVKQIAAVKRVVTSSPDLFL